VSRLFFVRVWLPGKWPSSGMKGCCIVYSNTSGFVWGQKSSTRLLACRIQIIWKGRKWLWFATGVLRCASVFFVLTNRCVHMLWTWSALKPGQCPIVDWRGSASVVDMECVVECGRDSDCTGAAKCCDLGCNRTCAQPMHSQSIVSLVPYPLSNIVL